MKEFLSFVAMLLVLACVTVVLGHTFQRPVREPTAEEIRIAAVKAVPNRTMCIYLWVNEAGVETGRQVTSMPGSASCYLKDGVPSIDHNDEDVWPGKGPWR